MTEKQEELKQRLVAVLRDLEIARETDPEAIWMIGSLASTLVEKAKAASWTDLKDDMTQDMYAGLVRDFQTEGNALWQAGKPHQSYAIQALAVSIVASTQRSDPTLRQGEKLLDDLIEGSVTIFRRTQRPN